MVETCDVNWSVERTTAEQIMLQILGESTLPAYFFTESDCCNTRRQISDEVILYSSGNLMKDSV